MKNSLKELRIKHGISQTALAEAVGTTKRTIYSIEVENKDIHLSLARKLAAYFGCGIDDIFVDESGAHTSVDKAMWYVHVVQYTSEELDKPIWETAKLLERSGLASRVISGYDVLHTQGYGTWLKYYRMSSKRSIAWHENVSRQLWSRNWTTRKL